jgi:peptidase S41-like protein
MGLWSRNLKYLAYLLVPMTTAPALGVDTAFDSAPWIQDLHQMQSALSEKYANFEWAVFDRQADLSALFAQAESRIRDAGSDAEARGAIDRLTRNLGDGHVVVDWPARRRTPTGTAGGGVRPTPHSFCQGLGYEAFKSGEALGPYLPHYQPLTDAVAPEFPSGLVQSGAERVGILRIGLFAPQGAPLLCESARATLQIDANAVCDERCADHVENAAYTQLSRDLATRVRMLQSAGATVLVIDLTGNGGGSEWAEAAARMLTARMLRSARIDFVRGAHWVKRWQDLADALQEAQSSATEQDRALLTRWAEQVERARAEATTSCPSAQFWLGERPNCQWLGRGFYATGLLAEGSAAFFRKKPWGPLVFTPSGYEFEEALWRGPLAIVVDGNTGSAAEEFAAELQDNRAAVIIGAPTAGAGCGYTDGGTPTTLSNSGAVLRLPDCARFRSDGANQNRGVDPDVLVGFRTNDGIRHKALRLAAALTAGVAAANRLHGRRPQNRASTVRAR